MSCVVDMRADLELCWVEYFLGVEHGCGWLVFGHRQMGIEIIDTTGLTQRLRSATSIHVPVTVSKLRTC